VLAVGDFMSSVIDEGGHGRFGAYSWVELERFFHLDDEDRRLIRTVPIDPPHALPQINSRSRPDAKGRRARSSRTLPQIKGRCLR
jgi:hypothetical protein